MVFKEFQWNISAWSNGIECWHTSIFNFFNFETKQQEEEDDNIEPKDSMFEIIIQCLKGWCMVASLLHCCHCWWVVIVDVGEWLLVLALLSSLVNGMHRCWWVVISVVILPPLLVSGCCCWWMVVVDVVKWLLMLLCYCHCWWVVAVVG